MQVLGERITALITVIQSFAFFPVPRLNTAPLLSCRSVSKLPSDTSPGGFAPDSTVICDPDRGGKQKNGFRRTIGSSSRFTNSDVCRSLSVMGNICVWDGGVSWMGEEWMHLLPHTDSRFLFFRHTVKLSNADCRWQFGAAVKYWMFDNLWFCHLMLNEFTDKLSDPTSLWNFWNLPNTFTEKTREEKQKRQCNSEYFTSCFPFSS